MNGAAHIPIEIDTEKIARFCLERGIRALSLFGSVLRDDFNPARSDIDVFAEFEPAALRDIGLRYFSYANELAAILGRPVDFCSQLQGGLRDHALAEAVKIYEHP